MFGVMNTKTLSKKKKSTKAGSFIKRPAGISGADSDAGVWVCESASVWWFHDTAAFTLTHEPPLPPFLPPPTLSFPPPACLGVNPPNTIA